MHLTRWEDLGQDGDHVTLEHIQGQNGIDPIRQELWVLLGVFCRHEREKNDDDGEGKKSGELLSKIAATQINISNP